VQVVPAEVFGVGERLRCWLDRRHIFGLRGERGLFRPPENSEYGLRSCNCSRRASRGDRAILAAGWLRGFIRSPLFLLPQVCSDPEDDAVSLRGQ